MKSQTNDKHSRGGFKSVADFGTKYGEAETNNFGIKIWAEGD